MRKMKRQQTVSYTHLSGKFVGTEMHMTKRGSRIARRAVFAVALASIRTKRNGEGINPYLREYYEKKSGQKPKMVALGAVMHKVCNLSLIHI